MSPAASPSACLPAPPPRASHCQLAVGMLYMHVCRQGCARCSQHAPHRFAPRTGLCAQPSLTACSRGTDSQPRVIKRMIINTVPRFASEEDGGGCRVELQIYQTGKLLWSSTWKAGLQRAAVSEVRAAAASRAARCSLLSSTSRDAQRAADPRSYDHRVPFLNSDLLRSAIVHPPPRILLESRWRRPSCSTKATAAWPSMSRLSFVETL